LENRFAFLWIGLGLYCVVSAITLSVVCFAKIDFLGLEKYYENYWYVIYATSVVLIIVSHFVIAKLTSLTSIKDEQRPDQS
jgi:hypothetical protein